MPIMKVNKEFIEHYGVKGMRWGVRKDRRSGSSRGSSAVKKGVRNFFLGNPETSLFYKKGRENFKKEIASGRAALSKISDNKIFRAMVFDKDKNMLTRRGRAGIAKAFNASMEQKYAGAVKREKARTAAQKAKQKQRVDATRKLIDQLIADDKAISKKFGTNYDEVKERAWLENFFKDDLKED